MCFCGCRAQCLVLARYLSFNYPIVHQRWAHGQKVSTASLKPPLFISQRLVFQCYIWFTTLLKLGLLQEENFAWDSKIPLEKKKSLMCTALGVPWGVWYGPHHLKGSNAEFRDDHSGSFSFWHFLTPTPLFFLSHHYINTFVLWNIYEAHHMLNGFPHLFAASLH